jgi:hypothetical protein
MTGVALGRLRSTERVVVSESSPYGAVAVLEGHHKVISRPGFRPRHWESGDWLDSLPAEECFDLSLEPGERHGKSCKEPWAQELLDDAERYIASSFPGELVLRAEPHGSPCRLDVGAAKDAGVRFFGEPPGASISRVGGSARLALGLVDGPVWIAIQPRDDERALSLDVAACGNVRTATGERLPLVSETGWSQLLWRGKPGLPDGTVVFSVSPGSPALSESADQSAALTARLRSLGYVSSGKLTPAHVPSAMQAAPESLPPPGRIRIRVES